MKFVVILKNKDVSYSDVCDCIVDVCACKGLSLLSYNINSILCMHTIQSVLL